MSNPWDNMCPCERQKMIEAARREAERELNGKLDDIARQLGQNPRCEDVRSTIFAEFFYMFMDKSLRDIEARDAASANTGKHTQQKAVTLDINGVKVTICASR